MNFNRLILPYTNVQTKKENVAFHLQDLGIQRSRAGAGKGDGFLHSNTHCTWQAKDKGKKTTFCVQRLKYYRQSWIRNRLKFLL